MKLKAIGLTDVGRKRANNQDCLVVNDRAKLFVVADGMGGHVAGEVASQIATDTLNKIFSSVMSRSFDPTVFFIQAVQEANHNIYDKAMQNPSYKGMGTTLTALYFSLDTVYIAHVGDSRAYFIREGMVWQLSQDHSLITEQLVSGMASPLRNVITRSVGYDRNVEVDLYTKKIAPGDFYLLCTDGLYGHVKNKEMAMLVSSSSIEQSTKKMIELANNRGGDDNISAVVVQVESL